MEKEVFIEFFFEEPPGGTFFATLFPNQFAIFFIK
jgi:hypothetical protein